MRIPESTNRWIIVCIYLALMYFTTYVISSEKVLEGAGTASYVFLAAYMIAAIVLLVSGFVKFGVKNDYAWLYLGIIAVLLMIAALNIPEPKGRLHFLEYGVLFFLVYRALRVGVTGFVCYASAIILTFVFGVIDELLQSFYPGGFIDVTDIMNNTFAAFLAAGTKLVWERC